MRISAFVREDRHRTSLYRLVSTLAIALILTSACSDDDDDPLPPAPTGNLSGSVLVGEEGVADAEVALTGPVSRSASTDESGEFSFVGIPVGDYTATLTLPEGFTLAEGQTAAREVTVTAGGTATVDWVAEGGSTVQVVVLSANAFSPQNLTITAGTTVRWDVDVGTHTVTPDDPEQTGAWTGSGTLDPGDTFEHTFEVAGQTYPYHCTFHRATGMTGTIVVQ